MLIANNWEDYEIIDMADGKKLERWKDIILVRPDPQIIWKEKTKPDQWSKVYANYERSQSGGGQWNIKKKLPKSWEIKYRDLTFRVKPMGFKHTGVFPEQAINWDWMREIIKEESKHREIKVLNLFAYTGCASVACLSAGAQVVHVDSSRGMVEWAKENVKASGLENKPIRYLVDDVFKFVNREIRRVNKYNAIIMDPPSYGRGSNKEIWKFEDDIEDLIKLCMNILSDNPIFFLVNSYTTGISSQVLENILIKSFPEKYDGKFTNGEIGLPMSESKLILPCGIYSRWEKK